MSRRALPVCLAASLALLTGACSATAPTAAPTPAPTAEVSADSSGARLPVATAATPAPAPASMPAPAAASAVVMESSTPVRVVVTSIGVDSELMALGLEDDGTMEVPPGAFPAGWFTGAPTPGELGPAVIVGHIDWVTGPGVFHRLASLAVGDEIQVERSDGTTALFRTTEVSLHEKDAFPTDLVYGDIDHAGLRLISCGGTFNRSTGHYESNVVAFAELVAEGHP